MHKILIVEDEADAVTLLSSRLAKSGFKVVSAADTYEAIDVLKKEKPDLVLLDLMLPAGGGLTVLKSIRADKATAALPVIILTASHSPGYREEVTKVGVQGYVEKPYDSGKLIDAIKNALAK